MNAQPGGFVYVVDGTISADKVRIEEVRRGVLMRAKSFVEQDVMWSNLGIRAVSRREIIIWNFP